jgi:hypothetical protein
MKTRDCKSRRHKDCEKEIPPANWLDHHMICDCKCHPENKKQSNFNHSK